jgi:hypothetical protein
VRLRDGASHAQRYERDGSERHPAEHGFSSQQRNEGSHQCFGFAAARTVIAFAVD